MEEPLLYANFGFTNTTQRLVPARLTEFKSEPLLTRPSDYLASVVRFDISARTIPIAQANIVGPGTATDCGVCLTWLGVNYTAVVNFTPPASPPPDLPAGAIFDYTEWLREFNIAFGTAFDAALAAAVGLPAAGITYPPFFGYDPVTQLISLYIQSSYYPPPIPHPPPVIPIVPRPELEIWVNSPAFRYLASMPSAFSGIGQPNFKDYRLNQFAECSRFLIPPPTFRVGYPDALNPVVGEVVQIPQQAISVSSWNCCRSLVLVSPNLSTCVEQIPTNNAASQGGSAVSNFQSIISDFLMNPDDNPVSQRQTIVYLPTAEYRLMCMVNDASIQQVDLIFYWTDFFGRQFPVNLAPGGGFSVKLMFRARAYNGMGHDERLHDEQVKSRGGGQRRK